MAIPDNFERLQSQIIAGACKTVKGDRGALVLLSDVSPEAPQAPESGDRLVRKILGLNEELTWQVFSRAGSGLVRNCVQSGVPFCTGNLAEEEHFDPSFDALPDFNAHSLMGCRLEFNGEILGMIQVVSQAIDAFADGDLERLETFCLAASPALYYARHNQQDITEKKHLENILAQSEKLAAVGQLAAGVAHEINNPLTAIIANAQILHRELPANHDLQESVDLIARAGARAAQVVRNLLDFARKEDYHLGLTDLNETVEKALELVKHELVAHGARLEYAPDINLPPILASQDHLQSVWLNLLLNAIDSLDKSPGEIKVTTQRMGGEIYVSVGDNGKGIPPERLTRIFEPFYTTKAPGRGTGLGLSVSHRIVKQHGGNIRVESQVGLGSQFTVILPYS